MSDDLPLGSVISALRSEITAAAEKAKGSALQFEVGPIELELAFTAKKEGGAKAKIKFNVLAVGAELGGEGNLSREHVQKVKVTLTPTFVGPDGKTRGVFTFLNRGDFPTHFWTPDKPV
jgi:hypothetical protein